ncbi:MAG: peptide deformylase [Pseudobdellovibrionaceae bacterium]
MAKLEILTYPNPRLREVSTPVEVFDAKIAKLVDDMLETMYHAQGIGLAAPQVGETKQILVIDTRARFKKDSDDLEIEDQTDLESKVKQPLILINPKIVKGVGKTSLNEGCLSVPSYFEKVERFEKIEVSAENVKGKTFTFVTDGLLAVCVQHEMDHLEGKLFIDRISFLKSQKIKNQITKQGYPKKKADKNLTS